MRRIKIFSKEMIQIFYVYKISLKKTELFISRSLKMIRANQSS